MRMGLLALGALAAAAAGASAGGARAETVIKFGTFIPPQSLTMREGALKWIAQVEKDTNGRVTFQKFLGGALSRNPAKQYELLTGGVQDATVVLPSYTQKLFPDFSILALPYMFDSAEEASVAGWRLYKAGMMSGPSPVQIVSIWTNTNSAIHVNKTIRSGADLKGLKIRAAGPEEAGIIESVGAIPVGMSITQVAESLNRGVVDGALAGWTALKTFRIFSLIRTHYNEPYGVRSFFLGVRNEAWNKLSAGDQAILMKHGGEAFSRHMGRANDAEEAELQAEAQRSPDHAIVSPPADDRDKRRAMFERFHREWAEGHENGAKKYEALKKIVAEFRAGS